MSGMSKLHPFSVRKHAHDIEYRRNRVFVEMRDAETSETDLPRAEIERLELLHDALTELLEAVLDNLDGRVAYLTGKQIGLAKECVAWTQERRASSLITAGKTEYLQYV